MSASVMAMLLVYMYNRKDRSKSGFLFNDILINFIIYELRISHTIYNRKMFIRVLNLRRGKDILILTFLF